MRPKYELLNPMLFYGKVGMLCTGRVLKNTASFYQVHGFDVIIDWHT